jgi:hypothetical protein
MTTTDTATFIAGPLAGQQVAITPGARRQPNYRDDDGRPMPVRDGDREFIFRPLSGRPARRGYILLRGYGSAAFVHNSVFEAWKAGDSDVRCAAVRHYRSLSPQPAVPQQLKREACSMPACVAARLMTSPDARCHQLVG